MASWFGRGLLGEKVTEKALEALWDHVILPRIVARWGRHAVVEQVAAPDGNAAGARDDETELTERRGQLARALQKRRRPRRAPRRP